MRVDTYEFVCNQSIKRICSYDLVSPRGIIKITNNSTKCGPKICPSLEDFVTQRTSTKCGPKIAPHRRTLSHSGLRPNVVQKLPLVGGLCHTGDFDQMWSKYLPLFGGLCLTAECDQMWSWIFSHVEDRSRSGPRPNVVNKMPTIKRVVFESKKLGQRKRYPTIWFRSRLQAGPKIQIGLCQSNPSPKKWRERIRNATTQQ